MKQKTPGRHYKSLFVAAALVAAVSAAQGKVVFALSSDNQLLSFDTAAPGTLLFSSPVVSGLQVGEVLMAIDFRPASGELMGVSSLNTLYRVSINTITGLPVATATAVGPAPFGGVLSGDKIGMDFNPVVDRIRLTSNMGSNLRVNPNTGALSAQDTNLNPVSAIGETAYDRNFPGTSLTTLFGLNFDTNSLVRIGGINGMPSPNGGAVTSIGPAGLDFDSNCALDFGGTELLAVLKVAGNSSLFKLDPANGSVLHNYGVIGNNPSIIGMAVAPGFPADLKLQIKRVFNKPQKDSIKLSALLQIPDGFQVEGAQIHLNIGGVLRSYVLDSKGKAALGQDKVSLKAKSKNGVVSAQQAKFTAKLGGGNYVELEDEGLINADFKDGATQVFISLAYGTEIAQIQQPVTYTSKAGKSGKAKN